MILTDQQLAQIVLDVGWQGDAAVTAVALALAASGGDAALGGPSDDDLGAWGVGLWQVSMLRYPGLAKFDLTDPLTAARSAHALWHATGHLWDWCPAWSGERHLEFEGRARAAVAAPSRVTAIGDTPPADDVRSAAATATSTLRAAARVGRLLRPPTVVTPPPFRR